MFSCFVHFYENSAILDEHWWTEIRIEEIDANSQARGPVFAKTSSQKGYKLQVLEFVSRTAITRYKSKFIWTIFWNIHRLVLPLGVSITLSPTSISVNEEGSQIKTPLRREYWNYMTAEKSGISGLSDAIQGGGSVVKKIGNFTPS